MASEHAEAVAEAVTAGLTALAAENRSAADVNFRHAVHICGNAADVADEIIRQTGGTVP